MTTDPIDEAIDEIARALRQSPPPGLTSKQLSEALARLRPTIRDLLTAAVASAQHSHSPTCACRAKSAPNQLALDYTPRAFPGARAPDGPAPEMEGRLVGMGLAEPSDEDDKKDWDDDDKQEWDDAEEAWGLANYIDGSERRARSVLADLESEDPDEDALWMANIGQEALEQELLKLIQQQRARRAKNRP